MFLLTSSSMAALEEASASCSGHECWESIFRVFSWAPRVFNTISPILYLAHCHCHEKSANQELEHVIAVGCSWNHCDANWEAGRAFIWKKWSQTLGAISPGTNCLVNIAKLSLTYRWHGCRVQFNVSKACKFLGKFEGKLKIIVYRTRYGHCDIKIGQYFKIIQFICFALRIIYVNARPCDQWIDRIPT